MNKKVEIKRTSNVTADCSELLIRDKQRSKIIFKPTLVVNSRKVDETVKGKFIYVKDNVIRSDEVLATPKKLSTGQWMEIDLHSDEVMMLFNYLKDLYCIEELDDVTYIKIDTDKEKFLNFFEEKPEVLKDIIVEQRTLDLILESEEILIALSDRKDVLRKIIELDSTDLNNLIAEIQVKSIEKVCKLIKANLKNDNEEFWQRDVFTKYAWILSQLVAKPVVLFKDKAYLGGKTLSNDSGKIIDYVYKNNLNDNIVLIEIKTPETDLMLKKEYRTDVYPISKELSGSISQCLMYKDVIQKQYSSLVQLGNEDFQVINPKSFIIIGTIENLSKKQKMSFELFRRELKDVEVITYDEILERFRAMYKCLK